MQRILIKGILFVGLLFLMYSCFAPASKEDYLKKFEEFIERIEKEHKQYTQADWKSADKRFEKLSGDWYRKFKGEYTLEDQIRIKGFIVAYKMYKGKTDTGNILDNLFKEDIDDFQKRLDDYLEKDAEKNIENLKKEAAEIGDAAIKLLDDFLKDLEEK